MMALWEKAIKPTLFDYGGEVLLVSLHRPQKSRQFFSQHPDRPPVRI